MTQKKECEAKLAALKTADVDDNDPNVVALTQGIAGWKPALPAWKA